MAQLLRSFTLVQRAPRSIFGGAQKLFPSLLPPLLHLTRGMICGTGTLAGKHPAVSSDQGST